MDDIQRIEKAIGSYLPKRGELDAVLIDSMEYSLKAGGKRVRPRLTLAFCRACGGSIAAALPFACAVELIHTYSLIHDDLPCMDNDDYRRGKPSNHIVFGEAAALLAGDALQSLAFEIMLSKETASVIDPALAMRAAHMLACCCGAGGMVSGQIIDLENEGKRAPAEVLRVMDEKKTGALIKAACCMGCIVAGAEEKKIKAASVFAENIGTAFQIVDDILDVTSTSEALGKPVGSDCKNEKSTYVSLLGLEKCRALVQNYTKNATDALCVFDGDISALREFAEKLALREH